jgi:hypothetical protein
MTSAISVGLVDQTLAGRHRDVMVADSWVIWRQWRPGWIWRALVSEAWQRCKCVTDMVVTLLTKRQMSASIKANWCNGYIKCYVDSKVVLDVTEALRLQHSSNRHWVYCVLVSNVMIQFWASTFLSVVTNYIHFKCVQPGVGLWGNLFLCFPKTLPQCACYIYNESVGE